jgi:hypothetical protein
MIPEFPKFKGIELSDKPARNAFSIADAGGEDVEKFTHK